MIVPQTPINRSSDMYRFLKRLDCHNAAHPWEKRCLKVLRDMAKDVAVDSGRLYFILYSGRAMIQILLRRGLPKDLPSFFRSYSTNIVRSTGFITTFITTFIGTFCSLRRILGETFLINPFICGFTAGYLSIKWEKQDRKYDICTYMINQAGEILYKYIANRWKMIPRHPGNLFFFIQTFISWLALLNLLNANSSSSSSKLRVFIFKLCGISTRESSSTTTTKTNNSRRKKKNIFSIIPSYFLRLIFGITFGAILDLRSKRKKRNHSSSSSSSSSFFSKNGNTFGLPLLFASYPILKKFFLPTKTAKKTNDNDNYNNNNNNNNENDNNEDENEDEDDGERIEFRPPPQPRESSTPFWFNLLASAFLAGGTVLTQSTELIGYITSKAFVMHFDIHSKFDVEKTFAVVSSLVFYTCIYEPSVVRKSYLAWIRKIARGKINHFDEYIVAVAKNIVPERLKHLQM